jgi:hypothetical protein
LPRDLPQNEQAPMPNASHVMLRLTLYLGGMIGWLLALLAVLKLSHVDLGWSHSICGPWGCGPPLMALLSCHGFWLVLLSPPAALAARRTSPDTLRWVVLTATLVGLAGVLGVVGWQAATYLPRFDQGEATFFLQRCLFIIATTVEFPMLQLLLLAMAGWLYADRRRRRFVQAQRRSDAGIVERTASDPAEPINQGN